MENSRDGESRKRDICRGVWVYGLHLFLDFPGPFYEHLNQGPNSNVIEDVPLHLRIP